MSPTPSRNPTPSRDPTPSHEPTEEPHTPSREPTEEPHTPSREPTEEPYTPSREATEEPQSSETEPSLQDPYANLPSDTHAERYPNLTRQEARVLTKKTLTEAQKATRALRVIADKEKNSLLTTDLEALLTTQHKELEDLAKKHAVKVEYLQNLVNQSSHFKRKRGVTLQNALLHHKAVEVNTGMFLILWLIYDL
jgi:hypothetical protein